MWSTNTKSRKRSRKHGEHPVEPLITKRGKYPQLTIPRPTIPEHRRSLSGRPKTTDISWGGYQKLSKRDKQHGNQDLEELNCIFQVIKKPTSDRESSEGSEILGSFLSFREARSFTQDHLRTLGEESLVLTQERPPKEREVDQTLLQIVGPNWDISVAARRILDETIDIGNQPDVTEQCLRTFCPGQEASAEDSKSNGDIQTARPGDVGPERESASGNCVTTGPVDMGSEATTSKYVPVLSKRRSKDSGCVYPNPVAKRQKRYLESTEPSIRNTSEALDDSVGEVVEVQQKSIVSALSSTAAEATDSTLTTPVRVYVVKEVSFESFRAKDQRIIGLFTTLTDAVKQVQACWEDCADQRYSNVEYLDGYHEDGRLWWTCRDEDGDGHDVDTEIHLKSRDSMTGPHSREICSSTISCWGNRGDVSWE
ncbi:hypothetical protein ONS95_003814 [Cadophora gregata]|uniref:uncharacterized protein n=1 Tax=Cadophora gregata TaxID=51156 RepID=UPI0026DD17D6|nr:uncharacterized protein ONS95_003814 [Cadophora gregata]KAK0107107.1 hypothetical protein ONS95_003814 [Cadophora gregata]KAK0116792.1 hypothetical protein ONS96_012642 [Cadophora gregata f. sp. sojae]